jgi:hypothetical protein
VPSADLPKIEVPLDLGSGAYEIYFKAWFAVNGYESTVVSDTIFLNHQIVNVNEKNKFKVLLFPTVSGGMFNLLVDDDFGKTFSYMIYNNSGHCIIEKSNLNLDKTIIPIDLTGNAAGIYFVSITIENKRIVKKIIIN